MRPVSVEQDEPAGPKVHRASRIGDDVGKQGRSKQSSCILNWLPQGQVEPDAAIFRDARSDLIDCSPGRHAQPTCFPSELFIVVYVIVDLRSYLECAIAPTLDRIFQGIQAEVLDRAAAQCMVYAQYRRRKYLYDTIQDI